MRTLAKLISELPIFQSLLAKANFTAVAAIILADWRDLDAATSWCEYRWSSRGHGYRRRLDVAREVAEFEIDDATDAVEFRLKFG